MLILCLLVVTMSASMIKPAWGADLNFATTATPVAADAAALDGDVATAARAGTTRRALGALAALARRLGGWWVWARDLADALDELLRIMDDARYAAHLRTKVDDLEKKVTTLEQAIAAKSKPERGDDSARRFLDAIRRELRQLALPRPPHRPCPTAQHRALDGTCKDRRLVDAPMVR
jgi:hypothetical protein